MKDGGQGERLKMNYIHRNWNLILLASAMVVLGCLAADQRSAQAQSSVAGWPEKNYTVAKLQTVPFNTRASVLRAGTFENAAEEQKFTDYYNQSLFPNVTNPKSRESPKDDVIAKLRIDLRACEKPQDQPQDVFNKLVDLTLDYMTKVAGDSQYHPVARVNAMLAIGEVNSPKAAKVLLETAFKRGELFPIRVAATAGLVRMAGTTRGKEVLSADPEIESQVIKSMVMLAKLHAKKNELTDGIQWMQGQAADILADLGTTGSKGEVPPALLNMLNDKDLPIQLRCKAARALGKLDYSANAPAPGPYLTALAGLADDAFASDQPADRARVRSVVRDIGVRDVGDREVGSALTKLAALSTNSTDQAVVDTLKKALQAIDKQTGDKMTSEDLRNSMNEAKASLDSLVK
jgi:hypothetical protein